MKRTKKEQLLLHRTFQEAEEHDQHFIKKQAAKPVSGGINGKIKSKIPDKALAGLEATFEKAFKLLFNKGDGILEKTGSIERARRQYQKYEVSLNRMVYSETLKAVDKSAGSKALSAKGTTTIEGSALGIAGIGLPDIPVFLAMLLKTSYEIAAAYGIDYRLPEEKKYTIELFNTIFGQGQEKKVYSDRCDALGMAIDSGEYIDTNISDEEISRVSNVLATDMMVAKFVQGMTFVGVLGGPLNYKMVHKVSKIAKLKYRKRFLYRLIESGKNV